MGRSIDDQYPDPGSVCLWAQNSKAPNGSQCLGAQLAFGVRRSLVGNLELSAHEKSHICDASVVSIQKSGVFTG